MTQLKVEEARTRLPGSLNMVLAIAVIVAVASLFCLMYASDDSDAATSGKVGDNVNWTLDGAGNLTITGTGNMYDKGDSRATYWAFSDVKSVTIGNGVTSIGKSAFSDCPIASVAIPDSVTSIGRYAFYACDKLATVTLGSGVTSIEQFAFASCTSLTSITIPDSVTSIGQGVFLSCSSLATVTLGSGVTSIGQSMFQNCSSLATVTLGSGVTSIGDGAFYNCTSLASITIPDSVTSIGDSAFSGCTSLKSVYFSHCLTSISSYAFSGCKFFKEDGTEVTDLTTLNGLYHGTTCTALTSAASHTTTVITPGKAATCTEPGLTDETKCSVCGLIQAQKDIPALGHSYGELIPEVPAVCDHNGTKAHYECSRCHELFVNDGSGYTEVTASDLVISALGHSYGELIPEVPAAVDHEGIKAHYECSACHKLFVNDGSGYTEVTASDIVIPRTGNDSGNTILVLILIMVLIIVGVIVIRNAL